MLTHGETMFVKLNDKFDTLYCPDNRRWSSSDFIVWVELNLDCDLGCRYCHEHKHGECEWITCEELNKIVEDISIREGKPNLKIHFTPTLGDILLHPQVYHILDWITKEGHALNICSYFPRQIELSEVSYILNRYDRNICLCCSLHGYTDKQREQQFPNPHKISDLLPILNRRGTFLNTVYIFSTLPLVTNTTLDSLNPQNTLITLLSLIDYKNSIVLSGNPLIQYSNIKHFIPNNEALYIINGRKFSYISGAMK